MVGGVQGGEVEGRVRGFVGDGVQVRERACEPWPRESSRGRYVNLSMSPSCGRPVTAGSFRCSCLATFVHQQHQEILFVE